MFTEFNKLRPQAKSWRAFTLIEIMVVVVLLSVIIIGLVAMFNQTQRALLSSNAQTDVLASGRAVSGLIANDLAQMMPSDVSTGQNFHVELEGSGSAWYYQQLKLTDPNDYQGTVMDRVFLVTHSNLQWNAVGYAIDTPWMGVGTLYRFCTNNVAYTNLGSLLSIFTNNLLNSRTFTSSNGWEISRLADGVVHFRLRAYDTNGYLATNIVNLNPTNAIGLPTTNISALPIVVFPGTPPVTNDFVYMYYSNAVPVSIELELGVLEPAALARFDSMTNNSTASLNYLVNHAGQVHLFRQRVSVLDFDPTAYQ